MNSLPTVTQTIMSKSEILKKTKKTKANNTVLTLMSDFWLELDFKEYLSEIEENFDDDMEKGKYQFYVEKYPERLYEIFSVLMYLTYFERKDIQYFIDHGLNLDQKVRYKESKFGVYPGDCGNATPLLSCAEYKWTDRMKLLLKLGADPYTSDGKNNVLSNFIQGHYYGDNPNRHESFINVLIKYCNVYMLSIPAYIIEDKKEEIGEDFAPFIQDLIAKCPIVQSDSDSDNDDYSEEL